jgi:hypothetical protein
MYSNFRRALAIAALGLAASFGAHATTVNLDGASFGRWQAFDVDDFAAQSANPLSWIDTSSDFSELTFRITLAAPAYLRVVDSGFAGDIFRVFDNGLALGITSAAGTSAAAFGSSQEQLDLAFADSAFSRGEWLLSAGDHTITGVLAATSSPFNATVGGLMVTAVPEPDSLALLLAGLLLIGSIARRRS